MKRIRLRCAGFSLPVIALAITGGLCAQDASEKPNILLFLVDDMGLMDTSAPMLADDNGQPQRHPLNDWYRTPNMERLAAQGVRFSHFFITWRDGDWKVMYEYFEEGDSRYSLYDLANDPSESNNLAPQQPERLQSMMQGMRDELDAVYPVRDGKALKPVIPRKKNH